MSFNKIESSAVKVFKENITSGAAEKQSVTENVAVSDLGEKQEAFSAEANLRLKLNEQFDNAKNNPSTKSDGGNGDTHGKDDDWNNIDFGKIRCPPFPEPEHNPEESDLDKFKNLDLDKVIEKMKGKSKHREDDSKIEIDPVEHKPIDPSEINEPR